jgi:hypothetical protein
MERLVAVSNKKPRPIAEDRGFRAPAPTGVNLDKLTPGLTSGRGAQLLAGWSVNLPMLSMFRKEEAPAHYGTSRPELLQDQLSSGSNA